jgi:EmrB/QacA subfamily drug resistance transporter
MAQSAAPPAKLVEFGTPAGRWVLLATVLGSGMAMLDATVVNVALPVLGEDLRADVAGLQWTLNGYLLPLAALILLGGSLGDRYGRQRVFVIGVIWFAVASLLCGLAQSVPMLVAARLLQGIGGALLTPGSLAIIEASFRPEDRGKAIGAWSGLGGIFAAIGPFLGGWIVDALAWQYIFLLNVPVAAVVVAVAVRHVPESVDPTAAEKLDVAGALLGAVGLAGVTYALIEAPEQDMTAPAVVAAGVVGVAALIGFVAVEARSSHAMLPLDIFSSRQFTWANVVTFAVYGAMSAVFFLLVVHLQQVVGYSPLAAGLAGFPITVIMLALSSYAGDLAQRIGPRVPMSAGPIVAGLGILLMARIGPGASYLLDVLPSVVVFGLGLSLTVAPLTITVLAAVNERHAGLASGVNNAIARVAALLAVAVVPPLAGITGDAYTDPARFAAGFRTAATISGVGTILGGLIAWLTISNQVGAPAEARAEAPAEPSHRCCGVEGPPLRRAAVTSSGSGSGRSGA